MSASLALQDHIEEVAITVKIVMDLLARRWKEIAEKPKTGLPLKGQSEINEGWDVHSDRAGL
ncbi:MAG: hypothetical protein WAM53_15990 [Terrimicrobiaceae bacterium]